MSPVRSKRKTLNDNPYVDNVFSTYQNQSGSTLLLAAVLFTFQIYGDFSGYSDIAIGTSKLFGIKLMRNFNVPYFSRDIAEFWRRWHISLTTWFRDYLYIPLGGSRCSKWKIIRNTFIIFLVSGLWHGADWTYVAWGGYHAVLFLPLILLGRNRKYTDIVAADKSFPNVKECCQIFVMFILVVIGWIIFRAETILHACDIFSLMFSYSLFSIPDTKGITGLIFMIIIMLCVEWVLRRKAHGLDIKCINNSVFRYLIYFGIVFLIFSFGGNTENFIYFQF